MEGKVEHNLTQRGTQEQSPSYNSHTISATIDDLMILIGRLHVEKSVLESHKILLEAHLAAANQGLNVAQIKITQLLSEIEGLKKNPGD